MEVAQAIIEDLRDCKEFNLFTDHDSINSVFWLACELLESDHASNFCHPHAAEMILKQAYDIV